ncbi:unnamed protein product [Cyclocybe aegerita]|uniref:Uncharacterized protein n=1 Tax=Cyclocybe aegerita TaxID=1973307 RepID=A0A8S0WD55_CYCAE|nr:unnamed protein product [Cyclocybe aegerita]
MLLVRLIDRIFPNLVYADFTPNANDSDPEEGTIWKGLWLCLQVIRETRYDEMGQLPASALSKLKEPFANRFDVPLRQNLVKIWNNQHVKAGMDDTQSAVLLVAPSFNASLIGAGHTNASLQPLFGNVHFKAYDIDFENQAANYDISQSLVTDVSYANLFGFGTAWFQNLILANRACGGCIVAWKGTNLTNAPGKRYGTYVADSSVIRVINSSFVPRRT